jgi:hypothetical protein
MACRNAREQLRVTLLCAGREVGAGLVHESPGSAEYSVQYMVETAGACSLAVRLDGYHIVGSPFHIACAGARARTSLAVCAVHARRRAWVRAHASPDVWVR